MKLYMSANSPYARKVRVVAYELGLYDKIEMTEINPRDPSSGFWEINPLGKIPALITDRGKKIYDSPVICEYLNEIKGDGHLLPKETNERWKVRTLVALVDGLLDAGMAVRLEKMRPENEQSQDWIKKNIATASRSMDALEREISEHKENVNLGNIGVACAISWLQLRHGEYDWLRNRPQLTAWYSSFSKRKSLQATLPDHTR